MTLILGGWCGVLRGEPDTTAMPALTFDAPGLRFDAGLHFDSGGDDGMSSYQPKNRRKTKTMTKFKLELSRKTVPEKLQMGLTHIASMTGNTTYPAASRVPTDAQVQTAQDDLQAASQDVDTAEMAWKQKIQVRDQKESAWDTVITARASFCEAVTPTDLAALQSTGLPLRTSPTPVGSLPPPGDLRAAGTDKEGEIELRCKTVSGASSYEWECKVHDNPTAPWTAIKSSTAAKILVPALTPGTLYGFRVRAVGSAGPGAWSDEATERAP